MGIFVLSFILTLYSWNAMASGIPDTLVSKQAPEDFFQLTARQIVLKAKLDHSETQKDSLLGALTELHMRGSEDNDLFSKSEEFGSWPRQKEWGKTNEKDPDLEKTKALMVARIDSLKNAIQSLQKQMEDNKALMQSQLKGGKP